MLCRHVFDVVAKQGARGFVPDKFVFGVLDYYFAVGVWVFGFWAGDKFRGRIVVDSSTNPCLQAPGAHDNTPEIETHLL